MGCGCSKYEADEPLVHEASYHDVSVYANMPNGTIAYFGPGPHDLRHIGVVLSLPQLSSNPELLLLEQVTAEPLRDVLTGTHVDSGVRLVSLDSRLRTLPQDWNVYYQSVLGGPISEQDALLECQRLRNSPNLVNSAMLVAQFHSSLGRFVNFTTSVPPTLGAIWRGRLIQEPYRLSCMVKPLPFQAGLAAY